LKRKRDTTAGERDGEIIKRRFAHYERPLLRLGKF
jgi:hypothetical protein